MASPGLPDTFNVAAYFVDRHLASGRAGRIAIECGDEQVSYQQLFHAVNRVGTSLRDGFDVRAEERVLLLMHDGPEFIYSFFGSIKIGAVGLSQSQMSWWIIWKYQTTAPLFASRQTRLLP